MVTDIERRSMTNLRFSAQEMQEVSAAARHAPSLFNLRPWRWRETGGSLELLLDRSVTLAVTDPDNRELVISCGAALHHAALAMRASGRQISVRRLPDQQDPDVLGAIEVVGPAPPLPIDSDLNLAARRRHVDRDVYAPLAVPGEVLADIVSATEAARVSVLTRDQRYAVAQAFTKAAMVHAADAAYRAELAEWSGLSELPTRGMPARSAPWHGQRYGDIVVRDFGFTESAVTETGSALTAGTLLLISTDDDDREAHLRAGEALGAVLCRAELAGLVSCPLSEAFEVPRTRAAVRHEVLNGAAVPQMVVRVGWPRSSEQSDGRTPTADG